MKRGLWAAPAACESPTGKAPIRRGGERPCLLLPALYPVLCISSRTEALGGDKEVTHEESVGLMWLWDVPSICLPSQAAEGSCSGATGGAKQRIKSICSSNSSATKIGKSTVSGLSGTNSRELDFGNR